MDRKLNLRRRVKAVVLAACAAVVACGGSQAPAESPEALPAQESGTTNPPAPATPESAGDGEHTMPDGTKMKGDHHGEHEGHPAH